jgi:hypothetical protein
MFSMTCFNGYLAHVIHHTDLLLVIDITLSPASATAMTA